MKNLKHICNNEIIEIEHQTTFYINNLYCINHPLSYESGGLIVKSETSYDTEFYEFVYNVLSDIKLDSKQRPE